MTLSINTNISALSAQRNLANSTASAASSIGKLSSGSRIVTAKDDAASLAIASGLKLDLASLRAADANVKQATSILQIADGGYSQVSEVLNRMKTLAATAQSDQISDTERGFLNTEYTNLLAEIDRIADSAEFNGVELLGGSANLGIQNVGASVNGAAGFAGFTFDPALRGAGESATIEYSEITNVFEVTITDAAGGGGNVVASQTIDLGELSGDPFNIGGTDALDAGELYELNFNKLGVKINMSDAFDATAPINATNTVDVVAGTGNTAANLNFLVGVSSTDTIGITLNIATQNALGVAGTDVTSSANAATAADAIEAAVETLNDARSEVGSALSRLEFAGSNVAVQIENSEAARSTLEDVDVAAEFTKFTSSQVLIQAGVSILAQANQQPSLLLQLLQ